MLFIRVLMQKSFFFKTIGLKATSNKKANTKYTQCMYIINRSQQPSQSINIFFFSRCKMSDKVMLMSALLNILVNNCLHCFCCAIYLCSSLLSFCFAVRKKNYCCATIQLKIFMNSSVYCPAESLLL